MPPRLLLAALSSEHVDMASNQVKLLKPPKGRGNRSGAAERTEREGGGKREGRQQGDGARQREHQFASVYQQQHMVLKPPARL